MVAITFIAGMAAPVSMKRGLEYVYACQDIPGICVKPQVEIIIFYFFSYEYCNHPILRFNKSNFNVLKPYFEIDNGICAPNQFAFGGSCDCSNSPGWTEAGAWMMYCGQDHCYSQQEYDFCIGKGYYHDLGDGTWCSDDRRHTACTLIREQGITFLT